MSSSNVKKSVSIRTLQRYWSVTRQYALAPFTGAIVCTIGFWACFSFANPYIAGVVVDIINEGSVTADNVFQVFGPIALALILVNLAGQACSKLQDLALWKAELAVQYHLATGVFDTLCNQSMTFHSNRFGGSLVSQTSKYLSAYNAFVENLCYTILPIACAGVGTVGIMAFSMPSYAIILTILLCIYSVVTYALYKKILPLNEAASAAQNAMSGELSDSITNILAVKSSGQETYERSLFDAANRKTVSTGSKRMWASFWRGVITSVMIVVIMSVAVIFLVGGNAWFGVSAGTLVMMFTYTTSLCLQFNRLSSMFAYLNRAFGDSHDMTVILDEPMLVADKPNAPDLKVEEGVIDFQDVSFHYEENAHLDVFSKFNLHIPAGQRVGLVGKSGSGKTTLTKILLRLADISEGGIVIDGQDVREVNQSSLRRQIAYVPQEPLLFHRSIAENIAYGKPDATMDEIREAARRANALEFVEHLPQGFDTITGERGVKLSGGQRQRIAIARAILADAPILVLDEATSALDSESERLIQDALANLMEGRTSIVVAHRLSTVARLDRIVVLSEGKIVEDGTHEQLVEQGGEYSLLWSRQSGAFLGDAQE